MPSACREFDEPFPVAARIIYDSGWNHCVCTREVRRREIEKRTHPDFFHVFVYNARQEGWPHLRARASTTATIFIFFNFFKKYLNFIFKHQLL